MDINFKYIALDNDSYAHACAGGEPIAYCGRLLEVTIEWNKKYAETHKCPDCASVAPQVVEYAPVPISEHDLQAGETLQKALKAANAEQPQRSRYQLSRPRGTTFINKLQWNASQCLMYAYMEHSSKFLQYFRKWVLVGLPHTWSDLQCEQIVTEFTRLIPTKGKSTPEPFVWNGEIYPDINVAAKELYVSVSALRYRRKKGYTRDSDLDYRDPSKSLVVNGVEYLNQRAAAKALGIRAKKFNMQLRRMRGISLMVAPKVLPMVGSCPCTNCHGMIDRFYIEDEVGYRDKCRECGFEGINTTQSAVAPIESDSYETDWEYEPGEEELYQDNEA